MATRTTLRGNGMPGGQLQYRGDLPNIQARNVDPTRTTSWGTRLRIPAATMGTRSTIVDRANRRAGTQYFYVNGAVPMRSPIPGPNGYGAVMETPYQRFVAWLQAWQLVPSLFSAGYPRNMGVSYGVPQPETNATGGPWTSQMNPRSLFDGVQQVPRSAASVRTYATRSAKR